MSRPGIKIIFLFLNQNSTRRFFLAHKTQVWIDGYENNYNFTLKTMIYNVSIYEPRHEISNNMVCVTSKASDQSAHMRSLIRAFASRLNII